MEWPPSISARNVGVLVILGFQSDKGFIRSRGTFGTERQTFVSDKSG